MNKMSDENLTSPVHASRRKFLKQGTMAAALGLSLGAGGLTPAVAAARRPKGQSGKARNVIFLVSDGMSHGTLAMADQYRTIHEARRSHWMQMYDDYPVVRGLMEMASQNSIVTDSGAAASSWGCGRRVPNGRINVDEHEVEHDPILVLARRHGLAAGLVTTATVTHATPAGFAANGITRNAQADFAVQYLERGFEVVLGGGTQFFDADEREDGRDLSGEFTGAGYAVVRDKQGLRAQADSSRLLGLFSRGNVPYEVDRLHISELKESVPSLAEMSRIALQALSRNENGFIMQIEGARVDHAAHSNDPAGLVFDQLAFDDAVAVALEFYRQNPDTLVIVTTDHGNANPGLLSGAGIGEQTLGRLSEFKRSFGNILDGHEQWPDLGKAAVQERIHKYTGIEVSDRDARLLLDRIAGKWEAAFSAGSGLNRIESVLGQILANTLHIGWAGRTHTSDFVELAAVGPGSEMIKPFTRNTDMFTIMKKAVGIGG